MQQTSYIGRKENSFQRRISDRFSSGILWVRIYRREQAHPQATGRKCVMEISTHLKMAAQLWEGPAQYLRTQACS